MTTPYWLPHCHTYSKRFFARITTPHTHRVSYLETLPRWYDQFTERLAHALHMMECRGVARAEMIAHAPDPAVLRAWCAKAVAVHRSCASPDDAACARVLSFCVEALHALVPNDPFGIAANLDIRWERVLRAEMVPWSSANPEWWHATVRILLAHRQLTDLLFDDAMTHYGWSTYGSFPVLFSGEERMRVYVIRFPDCQGRALAPHAAVYTEHATVDCFIALPEMAPNAMDLQTAFAHMAYVAVRVNGRFCNTTTVGERAADAAAVARTLRAHAHATLPQEQQQSILFRECYPWRRLFARAEMGWRPTADMLTAAALPPVDSVAYDVNALHALAPLFNTNSKF